MGAYSSAGEHFVDIEGVTGSIPVTPTTNFWVEFQNKFYKGVGIAFTPIKISEILTTKTDEKNRNLGE